MLAHKFVNWINYISCFRSDEIVFQSTENQFQAAQSVSAYKGRRYNPIVRPSVAAATAAAAASSLLGGVQQQATVTQQQRQQQQQQQLVFPQTQLQSMIMLPTFKWVLSVILFISKGLLNLILSAFYLVINYSHFKCVISVENNYYCCEKNIYLPKYLHSWKISNIEFLTH